jgi:hypothetical protein
MSRVFRKKNKKIKKITPARLIPGLVHANGGILNPQEEIPPYFMQGIA